MVRVAAPSFLRGKAAPKNVEENAGQDRWTGRQDSMTTLVKFGLFTAIGCGVLAFLLVLTGFSSAPPTAPQKTTAPAIDTVEQATVSDLAQQFVLTWLHATRGDEGSLAPYVRTDGLRLPSDAAFIASDPRVASIEENTPQRTGTGATAATGGPLKNTQKTYAVTVSVSVRSPQDPEAVALRRYFAVAMVITDRGARAAAAPAPVPAPPTGSDVMLGYRYRVGSDHATAVSVQQFLAAMTAGTGEISRYISPGTDLRSITPPPYKGVKILDLVSDKDFSSETTEAAPKDKTSVRVLATAELALSTTQSLTGQYALTLTARGGRWEVSAIDPLPLLPAAGSSASATSVGVPAAPTSPSTSPTN